MGLQLVNNGTAKEGSDHDEYEGDFGDYNENITGDLGNSSQPR